MDISFAQVMLISTAATFGSALTGDRYVIAAISFVCMVIATRYLNICIEEKVNNAR